jgi:hypothetical protein
MISANNLRTGKSNLVGSTEIKPRKLKKVLRKWAAGQELTEGEKRLLRRWGTKGISEIVRRYGTDPIM